MAVELEKETSLFALSLTPLIDVVTLLAALDSVFWDQYGCLSSRIHFVEAAGHQQHGVVRLVQRQFLGRVPNHFRLHLPSREI